MAGATIKVRDADDGTIDMDIIFNPDVDNESAAHRLVQRFIEFVHSDEAATGPSEQPQEGTA